MDIQSFLEKRLLGPMVKISEQRHLLAVRDAMISLMPLTIVGAVFLLTVSLPWPAAWQESAILQWINARAWTQIVIPFHLTMGIMALFVAYNVAAALASSYKLEPIANGNLALVAFFLTHTGRTIVQGAFNADGESIGMVMPMQRFGGEGIFVAILCAIFTVEVYRFFKEHKLTIKMPEGVPPAVAASFEALIPFFVVVTSVWLVSIMGQIDLHTLVAWFLTPVKFLLNSFIGVMLVEALVALLWFMGIHGAAMVNSIAMPFWLSMIAANQVAQLAGEAMPAIAPIAFFEIYARAGGSGGTLGLVVAMSFMARSKYLKSVGRVSLAPSLFNINEPLIFGMPIMLNPFMMIPFILAPMVSVGIAYIAVSLNMVGRFYIPTIWTLPAPISAFLGTGGDWRALILSLVTITTSALIYIPFLKIYDKKMLKDEQQEESA